MTTATLQIARTGTLEVLVVDDSSTNRLILSRILQALGHRFETAEDGERAIEAAQSRRFDLILMDVQMPGIGGVEAARRIRQIAGPSATTPIIAVTADTSPSEREVYRDAGISGVVSKPLSAIALQSEMQRVIET